MEKIRQFSSCKLFAILYNSSYIELFVFLSKWLCTLCTEMCRMLKTLFLLFQRVPLLFLNGSRRWQNVPLHAECLRYSIRCKRLGDSGDVTTSVTVLQQQSATVILIATDSSDAFSTVVQVRYRYGADGSDAFSAECNVERMQTASGARKDGKSQRSRCGLYWSHLDFASNRETHLLAI